MDEKYNLTIKIMGTNLDGSYWKPYSTNRVVTKYAETVYEPKEDVPQGTLVKDPERTAYNAIRWTPTTGSMTPKGIFCRRSTFTVPSIRDGMR